MALPRGGVPVAYVVAKALRTPLDIFLVRKFGVPGHEELAMVPLRQVACVSLNLSASSRPAQKPMALRVAVITASKE